jgi:hypothetical protein
MKLQVLAPDPFAFRPMTGIALSTEQFTDKVELEHIRETDGPYKNSFEQLFSMKRSLVVIDERDLADSQGCLNLVISPRIRGLGASGLLELIIQGMVWNR